ncbi:MAG: hypothetical protein V5A27_11490 [Halapricum sp.]
MLVAPVSGPSLHPVWSCSAPPKGRWTRHHRLTPTAASCPTLTFRLTVDDGHGKTATDIINVTVQPETDEGGETTTETGDGDGPGFGIVSGALDTAGGVTYAAKSLLDDDDPVAFASYSP